VARGIGGSLTDATGNCRRSEPGLGPLLERKLEAQKRTAQLQLEAVLQTPWQVLGQGLAPARAGGHLQQVRDVHAFLIISGRN